MRFRNTLVALLVLAGLAAFIYYYEYRGEEARESAKEAEKNVFTFEREKVTEIRVAKPGAPDLALRREGGQWKIVEPLQTRADPDKISSLLGSLSFLRIEDRLDGVAEPDLDQFKLKEPAARLTVKLDDGSEAAAGELKLNLGDKTPVGESTYAQKPGSAEVLLVSGDAAQILTADAASMRYKKVVGADAWKVARFSIEKGRDAVAFARGTGTDEWRIETPIAFPAEGSKVQGLWFDLGSLEAESFESENPSADDLRRFGLDAPALSLTVWTKSGSEDPNTASGPPPSVRIAFGAPAGGEAVYARRDDMPGVMKVGKEILDKLAKPLTTLTEYRDARAAPLDRWKLARIEATRKEGAVTLVKDQESSRWRWGGPEGAELPSEEVNALLDAIEGVKATGFVDAPPSPATQTDPVVSLTMAEGESDSPRTATIRIPGPQAAGGSSPGLRGVLSSASSSIYLVPAAAVQTLIDKVSALKEPAPQPPADPNAAGADPDGGAAPSGSGP